MKEPKRGAGARSPHHLGGRMMAETAKKYKIRLPKKHGEDAKFVGIDGVSYLVKRGEEVEVPKTVYDELIRAEAAEIRAEEQAEALAASL